MNVPVVLTGLPGMRKRVKGKFVQSPSAFIAAIRSGVPATAAGPSGAITAWKTKDSYQCEANRFRQIVDAQKFYSIAALSRWVREWFPKIRSEETA